MIQQLNSVPAPQSCPESALMMYLCNSTKSFCRWKDTNVPRPLLFSPKQNENPRPAPNHTTNPSRAIVATRVQCEPQRSSLSKSVREASEHHSHKSSGKTSPVFTSWEKRFEVGDGQKEKRNHRVVQLNKKKPQFQKIKEFNVKSL